MNNFKLTRNIILGIAGLLIISGCGGGGSSGDGSSSSLPPVNLETGYLIDSPVVGLNYECGLISGITQEDGRFECESNTTITFKIGSLTIGSIDKFTNDKKVYIQDIVGVDRDTFDDEYTAKIAVLLQSLDDDNNISDEINIKSSISSMFTEDLNLKDINSSKIEQLILQANKKPVYKYKAIEHLKNTFHLSSQKYIAVSLDGELISTNGVDVTIVKKINNATKSSKPTQLFTIGNKTYFSANDGNSTGLWVTDGTSIGTKKLLNGSFYNFSMLGDKVYFSGSQGWDSENSVAIKQGIYKSDGTVQGTVFIKEFSSYIGNFIEMKGILYFFNEYNIWKSDGTQEGTVEVANRGNQPSIGSRTSDIVKLNNKLYYSSGLALYQFDESSGISLVKNTEGYIQHIIVTDSKIYLESAVYPDGAYQGDLNLWVSDGTTTGTQNIKTITNTYDSGDNIYLFKTVTEKLYLSFNGNLWVSDGSTDGTINLGYLGYGLANRDFISLDEEHIYLVVSNFWSGSKLYKTDGSIDGTSKLDEYTYSIRISKGLNGKLYLTDLSPSTNNLFSLDPSTDTISTIKSSKLWNHSSNNNNFTTGVIQGEKFIFPFSDTNHNIELWVSDGTESGTHILKDINQDIDSSDVKNFIKIGDKYFFTALDQTYGDELWVSDGSKEGTKLLKDIEVGTNGSNANEFIDVNGKLVFVSRGTLWISDGTSEGTKIVKSGFKYIYDVIYAQNNIFYFYGKENDDTKAIWRSDGSEVGTYIISAENNRLYDSKMLGNTLYFQGRDATNGDELWKSDGTLNGTQLVKDIKIGTSDSNPKNLLDVNGTLYFFADDGTHGYELWKSDGTADGTLMVEDMNEGSDDSYYREGIVINSIGYMAINNTLYRLTSSDINQIVKLPDIDVTHTTAINKLFKLNDKLLIFAEVHDIESSNYESYMQLWISDGTESGTKLLRGFEDLKYEYDEVSIKDIHIENKIILDLNFYMDEKVVKIMTDGTSFGTGMIE